MNPFVIHTLFEMLAYSIGFQLFLRERKRTALPALQNQESSIVVIVSAIMGAALGAKLAFWLYDPYFVFADFPDWKALLGGKSIIGGLLGGLLGVEIGKHLDGIEGSTGDAFALPLAVGMIIGRLGCFLAGIQDNTAGNPTNIIWAVDYGDGIPRHPTQLYEIIFLAIWIIFIRKNKFNFSKTGDQFRLLMIGYLLYRFCIEFIRPMPALYFGSISGLQVLCVIGLLYYRRDGLRIFYHLKSNKNLIGN